MWKPQPKPTPRLLARRATQLALTAHDHAESAKARRRAGGRCEVCTDDDPVFRRCSRVATATHHLISGSGRRGRGDSALARWKLRVCVYCHLEIAGHVLVLVDPRAEASRVVYRRVQAT